MQWICKKPTEIRGFCPLINWSLTPIKIWSLTPIKISHITRRAQANGKFGFNWSLTPINN